MRRSEVFRDRLDLVRYRRSGYLACTDALRFTRALHDEIADLIFLDPPFNLGKDYGLKSLLETSGASWYAAYFGSLLSESVRVLKPGGALFLYHLPYWASVLSRQLHRHLTFRHWIAIAMKNGFARGRRLYPAHYALLYYTKGDPKMFRRPKLVPQSCRHCGRWIKDYGGYSGIIRRKGVNLSDVWDDLSPVRHRPRKHRTANELPVALTDRVVAIAGRSGGLLVDPFVGAGTSLVSAQRAKMHFVANDLSRRNVRICVARLVAGRALLTR